jgi:hypothetical protein
LNIRHQNLFQIFLLHHLYQASRFTGDSNNPTRTLVGLWPYCLIIPSIRIKIISRIGHFRAVLTPCTVSSCFRTVNRLHAAIWLNFHMKLLGLITRINWFFVTGAFVFVVVLCSWSTAKADPTIGLCGEPVSMYRQTVVRQKRVS